jgi:hypothetical protein
MADPIHIKKSHEGRLHRELGVPAGTRIPASKLESAAHSRIGAERMQAVFAINARHFAHARKSGK